MHRLYIKNKIVNNIDILVTNQNYHYLKNVLKMENKSQIKIFNERDGEWISELLYKKKRLL